MRDNFVNTSNLRVCISALESVILISVELYIQAEGEVCNCESQNNSFSSESLVVTNKP